MGVLGGLQHTFRRCRVEHRMTQADLAAAAGVSKATVEKVETGRGLPRPEMLEKMLDALGVGLPDLLLSSHQDSFRQKGPRRRVRRKLEDSRSMDEPHEAAVVGFHGLLGSISHLFEEFGESQ